MLVVLKKELFYQIQIDACALHFRSPIVHDLASDLCDISLYIGNCLSYLSPKLPNRFIGTRTNETLQPMPHRKVPT